MFLKHQIGRFRRPLMNFVRPLHSPFRGCNSCKLPVLLKDMADKVTLIQGLAQPHP
jgi:hypothetical protein